MVSRRGTSRALTVALTALLWWGGCVTAEEHTQVSNMPRGPDGLRDLDRLDEFFKNFEESYTGEENDEWEDLEDAERDALEERWEAELEAEHQRKLEEWAREEAEAAAGEQWAQAASNQLTAAYQNLPTGATPTGAARAGELIVENRAYYEKELERLDQARVGAAQQVQGLKTRITNLTANLEAYEADVGLWESLDWWSTDRADYLEAEIQKAQAQLPAAQAQFIAANDAYENTLQLAMRRENSLRMEGVRSDPELLAQETQRRANELVALEQELQISRLQFAAGEAQWQAVKDDLAEKIETARTAGDDSLADGYQQALDKVKNTYDVWLNGVQISIAAKGRLIMDAYETNARDGIGPRDKIGLISHLTGCGVDASLTLTFRDPNDPTKFVFPVYDPVTDSWNFPGSSDEYAFPYAAERIANSAASAQQTALGSRFGQDMVFDWEDFTRESLDAFYSWDTLTGAPERLLYAGEGAAYAIGDAVYGVGVFAVELGDTILETDQWYVNQFLKTAPVINQLGLEIDLVGSENIEAGGAFLNWYSSENVYDATQAFLDSRERTLEQQASTPQGINEAVRDATYVGVTAVTLFYGPEEVLLRGAAQGARALRGLGAADELAEAGAAGARSADELADLAADSGRLDEAAGGGPRDSGAGTVADDAADSGVGSSGSRADGPGDGPGQGGGEPPGSGPRGASAADDGQPPVQLPGPVRPGQTVDVIDGPLGDFAILTRLNPDGTKDVIRLTKRIGGDSSNAAVWEGPAGFENLVIKITQPEAAGLDNLGIQAMNGVSPADALAPRTLNAYPVSTPGMEGYVVTVSQRVPDDWFDATKAAIAANGGELTTGMQVALGRALDAVADNGFAVSDLKLDNVTFRPVGPPGGDNWIPVFFDKNGFVEMNTATGARNFHEALLNPRAELLDGPWMANVVDIYNDLARFDPDVDWSAMQAASGNPNMNTLGYAPDNMPPYNPKIGQEAPYLRTPDLDGPAASSPRRSATTLPKAPDVPVYDPSQNIWVNEFILGGYDAMTAMPGVGRAGFYLPQRGGVPKFLRDQGIIKQPLFLAQPPVRFDAVPSSGRCLPDGPLPSQVRAMEQATGAAGTGGTIGHLPGGWLDDVTNARGLRGLRASIVGGYRIGACDSGDCTGATDVIALQHALGDQQSVQDGLLSLGATYVINDYSRVKQAIPDDPYYESRGSWGQAYDDQWALKRAGVTPEIPAWPAGGGEPIIVAIVDTGLAWNHREVGIDRLWINADEVPLNKKDDDGNGYVDDVVGWNFVNQSNLPWDQDGHGTLVAGIIGASTNNALGTAGINPRTRFMVLRALDGSGRGRASHVAEAITYAADNGARVINVSIGGEGLTLTEELAIEYAHRQGALVVAAAGNEGLRLDDYGPAGASRALTVVATDVNDERLASSNFGPGVDLSAPGVDVLGPRAFNTDLMANVGLADYAAEANVVGPDRGYYRGTGTSFAAPVVSGVATLLMAANPALGVAEVERMLLNSAVDIETPGIDQFTGYGRIDARAALAASPDYYLAARVSGVGVVRPDGAPMIEVRGTVDADRMRRAWLEIGAGDQPAAWRAVGEPVTEPVRDGVIQRFDARELAGESKWTLRLLIEHENASRREARYVLNTG